LSPLTTPVTATTTTTTTIVSNNNSSLSVPPGPYLPLETFQRPYNFKLNDPNTSRIIHRCLLRPCEKQEVQPLFVASTPCPDVSYSFKANGINNDMNNKSCWFITILQALASVPFIGNACILFVKTTPLYQFKIYSDPTLHKLSLPITLPSYSGNFIDTFKLTMTHEMLTQYLMYSKPTDPLSFAIFIMYMCQVIGLTLLPASNTEVSALMNVLYTNTIVHSNNSVDDPSYIINNLTGAILNTCSFVLNGEFSPSLTHLGFFYGDDANGVKKTIVYDGSRTGTFAVDLRTRTPSLVHDLEACVNYCIFGNVGTDRTVTNTVSEQWFETPMGLPPVLIVNVMPNDCGSMGKDNKLTFIDRGFPDCICYNPNMLRIRCFDGSYGFYRLVSRILKSFKKYGHYIADCKRGKGTWYRLNDGNEPRKLLEIPVGDPTMIHYTRGGFLTYVDDIQKNTLQATNKLKDVGLAKWAVALDKIQTTTGSSFHDLSKMQYDFSAVCLIWERFTPTEEQIKACIKNPFA
jgi:hypothetical protein